MEATQISIDKVDKEDVMCIQTYTHIYKMEYYSAFKKNEIMSLTVTWMDLGGQRVGVLARRDWPAAWGSWRACGRGIKASHL